LAFLTLLRDLLIVQDVALQFEFNPLHHPVLQIQESLENNALSARVRDFTRACSSERISHQPHEKGAFGGNLAPKVHRRTRLFGFKREFGRFLSISTFGGGLSFKRRGSTPNPGWRRLAIRTAEKG
jgi:hypothetical protein